MIAICITTFLRDELLYKTIESIKKNLLKNSIILVGDQGYYTVEKRQFMIDNNIKYYPLPFNCGLSFARNYLVEKAKKLNCEYSIISADSILFNESMKDLNNLLTVMDNYDILGLDLANRQVGWEAKLNLIPGKYFELDFIDKTKLPDLTEFPNLNIEGCCGCLDFPPCQYCIDISDEVHIWDCDIIRNFFLTKTNVLLNIKWDDNLKACEHEDFFYRIKQARYKVGWTNYCTGNYIGERTGEYNTRRQENWAKGQIYLRNKWGINSWASYKNLDRAK